MAVIAMPVTFAHRLVFSIPLQIINDDQVEQAIVVYVDPRRGHRPQRAIFGIGLAQSGFRGDVGKRAVAIVVVKSVAVDAGDEDVFVAIVVVVANGHANVVASARQSGFFGDVGEVAVAVVFEETVGVFWRILVERFDVGSVSKEDVEFAVIVVIKNGHPAGHGFGRMAFRSFVGIEFEIDRLVGEADWTISAGGLSRCGLSR